MQLLTYTDGVKSKLDGVAPLMTPPPLVTQSLVQNTLFFVKSHFKLRYLLNQTSDQTKHAELHLGGVQDRLSCLI